MNRLKKIQQIRNTLAKNQPSVGSWMQIPNSSVSEIMGQSGYDWVAVDMEHGAISVESLPDIFRALELGDTLPLVRLAQGKSKDCKQALDAGAGGVIVPMIDNAAQLIEVRNSCRWPPSGSRGVAFSRANLFGINFENYCNEAQAPILVAMIEHKKAIENLAEILDVDGLDAILIGPYDLSASMGLTACFDDPIFKKVMNEILELCKANQIACGIHVVQPDLNLLKDVIASGYQFIAYSIDAVFLSQACMLDNKLD